MKRLVLVLAAVLALGCAAPRIPPPPPGPAALDRPETAIPSELDVVVRVDLGKVRAALGESTLLRLRQRAAERMGGQPEHERMIGDLLLASDTVLIAFRPSTQARQLDSVLVFRGRMHSFAPQSYAIQPAFGGPMDLGRDLRRHDRKSQVRSQPARVYLASTDTVVLVSEAALDSVERRLERGELDPHLEAPAKGLLAVAARGAALSTWVEDRSVRVAGLLSRADEVLGHADIDAQEVRVEISMKMEDPERARLFADALREITEAMTQLSERLEPLRRGLRVRSVAQQVVVTLRMPLEELSALVEAR